MKNCVYRFLNKNNEIIYIGKAKDLTLRLNSHSHLPKECYDEKYSVEFVEFDTADDMDFAERYYIMKFNPKYNTVLSDKDMSISSMELDAKIWDKINKTDSEEKIIDNYIDISETKDYLINKFELIKEKTALALSFIRENDIDITSEDNDIVEKFYNFSKEKHKLETKLKDLLIKEGNSEKVARLFIESGVYTKEELINKDLKNIEDTLYKKCEEDIFKYGYYKMKNYYEIDCNFLENKSHSNFSLLHFYNSTHHENGLFRCNEIDIEIRKNFINKIISNVEKRLICKFGELKKEVIFLEEGYNDALAEFYRDYNFIKFEEPFIIFKPINKR